MVRRGEACLTVEGAHRGRKEWRAFSSSLLCSNGVENILEQSATLVCSLVSGYVVYPVRVRHGGRKRHLPKCIVYGKPKHQGITQLKFQRYKRYVAEERAIRKLGGLRVLMS
ncbi:60S ribosomal protein L15-2 [Zea mays]|uniref:Ribosomal protein L15 n=1 Tax=Zea mays TaxID=4577 RepID=A0A1D6MV66_MAIZE|nr:60S ribosomal protein L15-2 [Zea mays]